MLLRGRRGWWGKWIWRAAVAISIFAFIWPILAGYTSRFYNELNGAVGALAVINFFVFIKVVMSTLSTANQSIIRERTGRTFELLQLTGISHWRFVLGKWAGVMKAMLRDYVWLWFLRVGMLMWASAQMGLHEVNWEARHSSVLSDVVINWDGLLLIAVLLLVFGFLELGFSAAIGIFIGMFRWSHRAGAWVSVIARIGVAVAITMFVLLVGHLFEELGGRTAISDGVRVAAATSLSSLFANGIVSAAFYFDSYTPYANQVNVLIGHLISMMLYTGLTIGTLRLATMVAVRQGINNSSGYEDVRKRKVDRITALSPAKALTTTVAPPSFTPTLNEGTSNIFDLPNADTVRVELYQYHRNVSQLHLRLMSDQDVLYAQFSGVAYMDVPSRWVGADFRVGTQAELQAALQANGIHLNSLMSQGVRLFMAQAGDKTVRIIAARAQLLDELPNRA
ncbi:MAG: hypothetical protein CL607_09965 [Anaerolineaceae bacterium]|nr:hypothetical protein [Anaerolineaceae bacterium]